MGVEGPWSPRLDSPGLGPRPLALPPWLWVLSSQASLAPSATPASTQGLRQGRGGRAHVQEQFKVAVHEGDPDEQTAPPEVPQLWDEEHRGYEI